MLNGEYYLGMVVSPFTQDGDLNSKTSPYLYSVKHSYAKNAGKLNAFI